MSTTPYLDAVLSSLPPDARKVSLDMFSTPGIRPFVELLVRLASDAPEVHAVIAVPSLANPTADQYAAMRTTSQAELRRLHNKRKRSATPPEDTAKRARLTQPALLSTPNHADVDNTPVYTLHALSVSSPVRKKLDITVHTKTLRLGELSFPLSSLKRAFLLPTRGKVKPYWTVVLLSSDKPVRSVKGASPSPSNFQIIFGVDAETASAFSTTAHPAPTQAHGKGTSTRPALLDFLRRLPIPVLEPSANVFSPVTSGGSLGLAAYQGAKEGTLWFLASGVLGEHKQVEYWSLEDLDLPEGGFDAIRLQSATGRTCSVFVRRRRSGDDDGEEGEEVEFAMVDGREQDGIKAWVRRYRERFGQSTAPPKSDNSTNKGKVAAATQTLDAKTQLDSVVADGGDSDSDSNFEVSSGEYDSGSPSSSSTDEEGGEGQSDDENSASDDDKEDGVEADAPEEDSEDGRSPDPAKHPLMRPGAVPRMTRAAMDMAASMVLGDLLSRPIVVDEDEEDELAD